MAASRRTVITGLGTFSPLGLTQEAFWHGLHSGKSGIRRIQSLDASALPCQIAGEIDGFNPKSYIPKASWRNLRMMARTIQLAVAAAQVAMTDAGAEKGKLDPTRFGVEFGAGLIPSELDELGPASLVSANCVPGKVDMAAWGEKGMSEIQPLWMLKYLPNMLACHVSILHDAQGPNNSITESDAASLLALGEAHRILGRDAADFFLVGGAESKLHPLSLCRQALFQALTKRNDVPEKACRPFDRDRDGLVLGEGAGVMVVEALDHARNRGARIYAEVCGFGAAFDRGRTGGGIARAMNAAMKEAGIGPSDLDHVVAHGLGTPEGDAWEARGLRAVVGDRVPVWGLKGSIGSSGAASGTLELAASVLALRHGERPGTVNCDSPDTELGLCVPSGSPSPVQSPYALKLAFTDLGQAAAVVVKKWDDQ